MASTMNGLARHLAQEPDMVSIDAPAVSVAHSLMRQYGRHALAECDKRVRSAKVEMDRHRMAYWACAAELLRSGVALRAGTQF
jgi:hypothetical protein